MSNDLFEELDLKDADGLWDLVDDNGTLMIEQGDDPDLINIVMSSETHNRILDAVAGWVKEIRARAALEQKVEAYKELAEALDEALCCCICRDEPKGAEGAGARKPGSTGSVGTQSKGGQQCIERIKGFMRFTATFAGHHS